MTWQVFWQEDVLDAAAGYLQDDPAGLSDLLVHLDGLETEPRPTNSTELGSPDLRRLRAGRYRVLYEVTSSTIITVIRIGRVP